MLGEVRLDDTAALAWRSLPGPPYPTGAQVLFRASGQTTSAAVIKGADSGTCVPAPPLVAGVVYAATVAPLRGPAEGPESAAVSVANVRTAVTATDYDGQRLSLSWDGADPAGTSGCRVEVLEGPTVIASRAATGGTATIDLALEPGAAHGVRLRWTTPGGLGPAGPTATVLAATAAVSAIAVSPTAVAVTIVPPAAAPSVARYVAHLFQGERRLASSPPVDAGPAPVATIACATAGLTGLRVRVQALVAAPATSSGPLGPASPVLAVGPTIKRAVVSGTTLELRWSPAAAPDGAVSSTTIVVAPTSGPATPKTFAGLPGKTAALTLDAGYLDPNVGWTVTASAVGPTGASPAGPAVALLAGAPVVGSANWNGERLRASWAWPAGASGAATATAYRLELFSGTTPRGHVVVDGLAGALVPDGPLDPGVPVRLAVSPLAPPAAFVAVPTLSVPWTAPQLTAAITSLDGHLTLSFAPATAATGTITGYDAVLASPGRPDAIVALTGTSSPQTIVLPPDLGGPFVPQRVSLRATGPQVIGPTSDPLPVLRQAPVVGDADFANGELALAWAPVAEPVDGYEVRVTGGASPVELSVPGPSARLPLTPGASARVTVVARAGGASGPGALGPDGLAGVPLLLTAPTVGPVAYDGTTLAVSVTAPVAPAPTTSGYRLELLRDGVVVRTAELAAAAAGQPLTLAVDPSDDPSVRHAVRVRARTGVALGPAAADAPALLAAPEVVRASNGADVALTARAGALPAAGRTLQAALTVDGVAGSPIDLDPHGRASFPALAPTATAASVAVRATYPGVVGPWSVPVPLPLAAPVVRSAVYDGETLLVAWDGDATSDHRVAVVASTTELAVANARGGTAALPLAPPVGPASVEVRVAAGVALGPAANVALVTTGPAVTAVTVDPTSGVATVTWPAATAPPASGYLVQLYRDGVASGPPLTPTTTSVALAAAPNEPLSVAVATRAVVSSTTLAGPFGPPSPVPTVAPEIADVGFDGSAASVRWTAVPGATGYVVSVIAPGATTPTATADAPADATRLRLPVTLSDPTLAYEVVVQAQAGPSRGVRSRAPLFVPAVVVQATDGPPRILRATTPAAVAAPVVAHLPSLGTLSGLPIAPAQSGANDVPFTLAVNPNPATASRFPYTLTIAGGALRFDAARSALAATYRSLLTAAEASGATAQGIFAIQQAISRLMPQSFDESLYYAYGLSATTGSVDLRPGTILRVASGSFDLTAVSGAPAWSSGYAPGPVVDFPIDDYVDGAGGPWRVGFDAFVAWLTVNGVLTVPAPQSTTSGLPSAAGDVLETGGAGAADLFFPDFRRPYHRLLVPDSLQPATPPAVSRTGQQFAIAAAGSWAAIDAATPTPGGGVSVAYLRGRTVLSVCIRVTVDGVDQVVPVGTTVGNLLDRLARRPPSTAAPLAGLRLDRALGPVVLDPTAAYDAAAAEQVHLDWKGLVCWGGDRDALSLPLLHGDRLRTGADG